MNDQTQPATPPAAAPTPPFADEGEVLLRFDLRAMKPQLRQDLEAHAHLDHTSPAGLFAQRLNRLLAAANITVLPA